MKKSLTMLALLAGAVSGYSQGQVVFADYAGFLQQQIFNVQSAPPSGATSVTVSNGGFTTTEYVGSTANTAENPQGSAVFAAGTALSGTGFDAELYASSTAGASISQLSAVSSLLHFGTTAAQLGFVKNTTLATVPGLATGATGTYAIAAWASTGVDGAATTLAAAQADGYAWGFSTTGFLTPGNPPVDLGAPQAAGDPALSGTVEGFSLGSTVPEPSTIALGVMGASALLFRRRK